MRRLGQALVLLVMAICAAGAAGFVVLAVQYHRFSSRHPAVGGAPARDDPRLAPAVEGHARLAAGDARAWVRAGWRRAASCCFRTVPARARRIPVRPPSTVLDGRRVEPAVDSDACSHAPGRARVQVSHVAVINLGNISRLVDGTGGSSFAIPRRWSCPCRRRGRGASLRATLRLNGPHAAVYLRQGAPGSEQRDQAERRVLRAIVDMRSSRRASGDLQATGTAVAHSRSPT